MKTMILATMMMIATSTAFAGKECGGKDAFKNLASDAKAIIAEADRRVVVDRTAPEQKALNGIGIVQIEGQKFYGTGFLVSPCHVLTNSHVAFENPKNAKVGAKVKFSVGQTGSIKNPFSETSDGKVIAHGDYDNTDATRNSDWALVKLSKSVGTKVGHLPFLQVKEPVKLKNRAVLTVGFPGNRTKDGNDFSQIFGDLNCKTVGMNALGYLNHTCQETGGQSGSPILTKDSAGNYYAIGMISGHNKFPMAASEDPNKSNMAVNFFSGSDLGTETQGDKIAAAIRADKCE